MRSIQGSDIKEVQEAVEALDEAGFEILEINSIDVQYGEVRLDMEIIK